MVLVDAHCSLRVFGRAGKVSQASRSKPYGKQITQNKLRLLDAVPLFEMSVLETSHRHLRDALGHHNCQAWCFLLGLHHARLFLDAGKETLQSRPLQLSRHPRCCLHDLNAAILLCCHGFLDYGDLSLPKDPESRVSDSLS